MNSETPVMQRVRLAVGGRPGTRVFRNTVGTVRSERGQMITFGLCPGSSDLIGYRSVIVTPAMVGRRLAVIIALEVKAPGAYTDPERLKKQSAFLGAVITAGGLAGFAQSPEEALAIVDAI